MPSIRKTKKRLKRELKQALTEYEVCKCKENFAFTQDLFFRICDIEWKLQNIKTIKDWTIVRIRKPTASDKVALTMTMEEYLSAHRRADKRADRTDETNLERS